MEKNNDDDDDNDDDNDDDDDNDGRRREYAKKAPEGRAWWIGPIRYTRKRMTPEAGVREFRVLLQGLGSTSMLEAGEGGLA